MRTSSDEQQRQSATFLFGKKLSSRISSSMLVAPSGIATSGIYLASGAVSSYMPILLTHKARAIDTSLLGMLLLESKGKLGSIEWTHLKRQGHWVHRAKLWKLLRGWSHLQSISLKAFPDYFICLLLASGRHAFSSPKSIL